MGFNLKSFFQFNFQSKLQFPYSKFISNEESVYLMIADLNEISELLKDEPASHAFFVSNYD
jgi:hypothetical protein